MQIQQKATGQNLRFSGGQGPWKRIERNIGEETDGKRKEIVERLVEQRKQNLDVIENVKMENKELEDEIAKCEKKLLIFKGYSS